MLRKKIVKGLLGVSAVAALFGALAAQAQTAPATAAGRAGGQPGAADAAAATAASSPAGSLSKADHKIMSDMARANMAEIETGKLAQTKSESEQVKNYAQQMIDDHTKALTELQQLATAKGATMPTELDAKHKSMAAKLGAMSGAAFDKAYMAQAGVADHKKVHAMLKQHQARAKDPELKALAAKMVPTVEQHLNAAQQIHSAKPAKPATGTGAGGDTMTPGKSGK